VTAATGGCLGLAGLASLRVTLVPFCRLLRGKLLNNLRPLFAGVLLFSCLSAYFAP